MPSKAKSVAGFEKHRPRQSGFTGKIRPQRLRRAAQTLQWRFRRRGQGNLRNEHRFREILQKGAKSGKNRVKSLPPTSDGALVRMRPALLFSGKGLFDLGSGMLLEGEHELLEDGERLPADAATEALHEERTLLSEKNAASLAEAVETKRAFAEKTGLGQGKIFVVFWYNSNGFSR